MKNTFSNALSLALTVAMLVTSAAFAADVTGQDATPPIITFLNRTPANHFGWNNGDVTLNWGCSEAAGVAVDTVSMIISTEGAE